MHTTTKWTPGPSGTLPMGPLEVPKNLLLKQKFKINLVFLITTFLLSVIHAESADHATKIHLCPKTISSVSLRIQIQNEVTLVKLKSKTCLLSLFALTFTQQKVIKRRLLLIDNVNLF